MLLIEFQHASGSGRETFVRLATCFLRAAGAISREEVTWVT